jgi:murein L,D-transpeptidase YafK
MHFEKGPLASARSTVMPRASSLRIAAVLAGVVLGGTALSLAYHLADRHVPELLAERVATADHIVVEKAERRLVLKRGDETLKEYRIALGANPGLPKEVDGDSRTPEGRYTIDRRLADSDFHLALHISYPEAQDREFAAALGRSAGGAIMIHGQPNDLGWLERLTRDDDWTDGCIAVSNAAIEELWRAVPDGTPITIRP